MHYDAQGWYKWLKIVPLCELVSRVVSIVARTVHSGLASHTEYGFVLNVPASIAVLAYT